MVFECIDAVGFALMKILKKELEKALELACFEKIREDLPNGKCKECKVANYVEDCPKCWMSYFIEKARKENER